MRESKDIFNLDRRRHFVEQTFRPFVAGSGAGEVNSNHEINALFLFLILLIVFKALLIQIITNYLFSFEREVEDLKLSKF